MLESRRKASIKKGSIRKCPQIFTEDHSEITMEKSEMIIFKGGENFVWIITVHSKNNMKMFEFAQKKKQKKCSKK
jgi:hypothetical protein